MQEGDYLLDWSAVGRYPLDFGWRVAVAGAVHFAARCRPKFRPMGGLDREERTLKIGTASGQSTPC